MEKWYVLYTKPRQEEVAEINLQRQNYETYLPRIKQSRRRRGKWIEVIEPLFSRYLFIRLSLGIDDISSIRSTRGVTGLVRFGKEPAQVPSTLIDALIQKSDEKTGILIPNLPLFEKGDEVSIMDGPLAGLKGIYEASTAEERALILVDILGRANRVVLHHDILWPTQHNQISCI